MTKTTNTATKNATTDTVDSIIDNAMKLSTQERGMQTRLAMVMFSNDVTYSYDEVKRLLLLTGKEKTDKHNEAIASASDHFANELKAKHDAVTVKATKEEIAAIEARLKAGRVMFERALFMVLFLRDPANAVDEVTKARKPIGSLQVWQPDPNTDPESTKKVRSIPVNMSGNQLVAKGKAILTKIKTPNGATAKRHDTGAAIKDTATALVSMLSSDAVADKSFNGETSEAMSDVLDQLLVRTYYKNGKFNIGALTNHIRDLEAELKEQAKKQSKDNVTEMKKTGTK
jgi:hypothetical protein